MQMVFRTTIDNTSKEQVYHLIVNIADYDTWLPGSDTFLGIRHISDNPVVEGTTYTDGQGLLRMRGEIQKLKENEQVVFHQASEFHALKLIPSGLDITIDYILVQEHNAVTVIRNYEVDFKGILKLLRPLALSQIRKENERILHIMKDLLEKTY